MITVNEPKSVKQLHARLTDVERLILRDAKNMARIEWLARERYVIDGATPETLAEVARLCGNKEV